MGCTTSSLDVRAVEKILTRKSQSELKVTVKTIKYRPDGKESEYKGSSTVTGFRSPGNMSPASSPKSVDSVQKRNEDKIELIFKSKRENVYIAGVSLDNRINYHPKNIKKSSHQSKLIRDALEQNFVFSSLDNVEKQMLANAMEQMDIAEGEDIIAQGQQGDYFYIIEIGSFNVLVSEVIVASLEVGRSFGELALLYNTPRTATVRAVQPCVVYSLDRDTFRNTLANSSFSKSLLIRDALSKVPLLQGLTETQIAKISDCVEVLPFPAGDTIIQKGTEGNVFYLIKEGTVRVSDVGNGKTYLDHDLGPGEYFGERALITGEPRAANIQAFTNVTLMALDRLSFDSLLGPLKEVLNQNMIVRVLDSLKWFKDFSASLKLRVARAFVLETYGTGAVIVKEGSKVSKFYIINEGNARIMKSGEQMGDQSAGTFFSDLALVDDEISEFTFVCTTDTECFSLTRSSFEEIIGSEKQEFVHQAYTEFVNTKVEEHDRTKASENFYAMSNLLHLAVLGSGTFGRVSLVQEIHSKKIFALKAMLKSEIVAHKQQNNVLNEKNVMAMCDHPFILRLFQTFKDVRKLYMLFEFVQGGELFAVIHTAKSDGLPDAQSKFYAAGISLAVSYLHKKEIAYRDLKPENCLIDKDGYPKLIDFGFAKIISGGGKSYTLCGTPEYLAPELVLGRGHNKAVDYWALGILIYEMQAGFSPFSDSQGMDQVKICRNIVDGNLSFPKNFNLDCKDLVRKLLAKEIQNRIGNQRGGTEDIMKHNWFSKVDFVAYTYKTVKAPWTPKLKNMVDSSHFDSHGIEDHRNDGPIDHGAWAKTF